VSAETAVPLPGLITLSRKNTPQIAAQPIQSASPLPGGEKVKRKQGRTFERSLAVFAVSVLFALAAIASLAQDRGAEKELDPSASPTSASAARFLVHSDLVLVPVTVTTGNGRVVPGLGKEDFSVFEDKVPQTITHFTSEDAPASIGLVVDCSDSMGGEKITKAREAVYALLENANPQDEFFLVRFSNTPELTIGLTSQIDKVRRAAETLEVYGFTALLDAVKMAWDEMGKARHTRKAIILISDGEDNHSRITASAFKQMALESDTTVYTLFIGESWGAPAVGSNGRRSGSGLLDEIARQTGGRMFPVPAVKHLPQLAAKIGSWIRSQYVLGYVPPNESRKSGYHRIQVKITKPAGLPKLHSTWRLGYYAPGS
jgi:Ca-activated chloride channel homolog